MLVWWGTSVQKDREKDWEFRCSHVEILQVISTGFGTKLLQAPKSNKRARENFQGSGREERTRSSSRAWFGTSKLDSCSELPSAAPSLCPPQFLPPYHLHRVASASYMSCPSFQAQNQLCPSLTIPANCKTPFHWTIDMTESLREGDCALLSVYHLAYLKILKSVWMWRFLITFLNRKNRFRLRWVSSLKYSHKFHLSI